MTTRIFSCLAAAFLLMTSPGFTAEHSRFPEMNPAQFRNSLHPDYSARLPHGPVTIPNILPASEFLAKTAGFEDLQVSEVSPTANFSQKNIEVAGLKGGRIVSVWQDNRLGPTGIFLQIFDHNGNPLGGNTALAVGIDNDLTDPKVCADTSGNFFVVWRDDVSGSLQAARFDSLGAVLTSVFLVSDTTAYAGDFDAACAPSGPLLVTWENYSAEGNDVVFRIFLTSGVPASSITKANSDLSTTNHWSPSITVGPNGDFAVVWEDYRTNDIADIYFRRFNAAGGDYGAEFPLSDASARDSARYMPVIAYNSSDAYLAAWVDLRSGQNIYTQRLTSSGTLNGVNTLLTTDAALFPNWEPDLSVGSSGRFLAAWTQYGAGNLIMLQRFASGVVKDGSPVSVSAATLTDRYGPAVTGSPLGNLAVFWTEPVTGVPDVHGAVVYNDAGFVRTDFKVNDDADGSAAFEPAVANYGLFDWTVVFTDQSRDAGDIMLQQIYVGGTLVGANRRINADTPGGTQTEPAVASVITDRLLISWTDVRGVTDRPNVYCRFSKPTYDLTNEILVNDDVPGTAIHHESDNAIAKNEKSLVVWSDTRSGRPRVYGQLFDAANAKIGANFLIGPTAGGLTGESPMVSADSIGDFVVTYLDRAAAVPTIEVKKVSAAGVVSDAFTFASDQSGYPIDGYSSGVNGSGSTFLVWHADNGSQKELFLTVLNASGSPVFATKPVTDSIDAKPGLPKISVDPLGYCLATWLDSRTGHKTAFRQIYDPFGNPVETNLPVYAVSGPYMQPPATAGYRGKGIFVWSDARAGGLQVYASQNLYSPTAADGEPEPLPTAFNLEQNHPNPFNPTTTIRFDLPRSGQVRLEVFNIVGQKVRTLADGFLSAGNHAVVWDGRSEDGHTLASGVYLYRLVGDGFTRTRQMILVK